MPSPETGAQEATGIKQLANQTSHKALCEAKKTKKNQLEIKYIYIFFWTHIFL